MIYMEVNISLYFEKQQTKLTKAKFTYIRLLKTTKNQYLALVPIFFQLRFYNNCFQNLLVWQLLVEKVLTWIIFLAIKMVSVVIVDIQSERAGQIEVRGIVWNKICLLYLLKERMQEQVQ
eukprot:TRINITY_DN14965_c0_g1_i1.p3 TRINITY_DN14965_c0_g1~~TRINITY_DN14965_c0_g1_i1.p3  ORF type:complete len:120 (+),score=0.32 TRINITY_DN14965_c0_g1_i1:255-614(+)